MARGAKNSSRKKLSLKNKKIINHRPPPENTASTSRNRFSILADFNDMDTAPESNLNLANQRKPPPIVVEANTPFTLVQELLGK